MRTVPLVASAVIGGAAVGLVLFMGNLVDIRVEIQRAPTGEGAPPATVASDLSEPMPSSATSFGDQPSAVPLTTPRQIVDRAKELITAGRLREAQELFLEVLLVNPDDREAMRGLVRVRGLMAREDAPTLRKQAKTYRRAISQGIETDEHYTAAAMDVLATASLLAVADLQDSKVKARSQPAPPKPDPTTVTRQPVRPKPQPVLKAKRTTTSKPKPQTVPSKPKPQAQRKPSAVVQTPPSTSAPEAPKPVQKPPSPPPPPAPLTVESESPVDMNEPFVTITIGPIASRTQASNIATDLTVAGYVARMRWSGAEYQITLGPYRRSIAEKIASRIRSRVRQGIPVSLNPSTN